MAPSMPEEGALLSAEVEEEVRGAQAKRPMVLIGAALAVAGMVAVAVMSMPRETEDVTTAAVSEIQGLSLFGSSNPQSTSCYTYAGETCHIMDECKAKGAVCKSGSCMCEAACMGADGMCHKGEVNQPVAEDFTLNNVHYAKYAMYFQSMSTFGQMKTTKAYSALNMEKDKFTLHKLPGVVIAANKKEAKFLLGSERWPTTVARMGSTGGTALAADAFYATDLSKGKPVESIQVTACWDAQQKAMMLGDAKGTEFAYLRKTSWKVYGSSAARGSHDTTTLWKPAPMFTAQQIKELPAC